MEYSKNQEMEKILGKRKGLENIAMIDFPLELGYKCPICGCSDERLEFSEYECSLWCGVCNKDIPSCMCMPDIDKGIDIFLSSIEHINKKETCFHKLNGDGIVQERHKDYAIVLFPKKIPLDQVFPDRKSAMESRKKDTELDIKKKK